MRLASLTAPMAALLLSSTALVAQEAQTPAEGQAFRQVYVDVDGSAVLIPVDLALEACGLEDAELQAAALSRFEGADIQVGMLPEMFEDPAVAEAAAPGTAAAAGGDGTPGTAAATADAQADPPDGAGTTMTAEANATTDAGNTTTDAGNQPAGTEGVATAEVGLGAGTAYGTETVAGTGSAEVRNVEITAAESDPTVTNAQGTADPTTSAPGQDLRVLAVCQIDVVRASELGIPNIANETVTD